MSTPTLVAALPAGAALGAALARSLRCDSTVLALHRFPDGESLVLLAAPEVDGVLFMHAPTAIVPAADIAQACLAQMQAATKPVLTCWLGGTVVQAARMACAQAGVAGYDTPERAVAGWLQLTTWAHNQAALRQLPDATLNDFTPDLAAAQALVATALEQGREWLDEAQAKALLEAYGVPVVRTMKVQGVDAAVQAAQDIGYPVALKVVSAQILHKSDVGGVWCWPPA